MKRAFFLISLTVLLSLCLGRAEVGAFGGCEEDCGKCHSLNKDEAHQILAKLNAPNANVVDVKMSPIKGLWQVDVEEAGRKGVVYVGFSKKYIVGGPIFEVDTAANKTQETVEAMNRQPDRYVDPAKISLKNAILLGDKNAPHKVIVFTDPECPFCARLHQELKKIIAERKDIAFYLELKPLPMHPDAYWKSESILCGKSLELLDANFAKKPIPRPEPPCTSAPVDENLKEAQELGITGTPTLIMPDGLVVVGARDQATIIKLALKEKGAEAAK
jgi:thiol:disulfide interchange protein DsbC